MIPAVALLLALSGCAAETPDSAYLSTLRESVPALSDVPDDELTGLGHQVCEMFDQQGFGTAMPKFIKQADGAGISSSGAGLIAGSAVGAYCPEYSNNF